ncbi:MAG TPA: CAP domain-containing protein [Gaiellaceae bacterium]|nr:CAP domain-containing protein [Gaiellaceae bacterium]
MEVSKAVCAAVGAVFVLGALAPAARGEGAALNQRERSLLSVVNEVRTNHDLRPLRIDAALTRAARSYTATMIRTDVFTHGDMYGRLVQSGARGPMYGENLAWGAGAAATARHVVRGWMTSPGHRANLLRPGWNRIGLGVLKGNFLGYAGATVFTADFAGR